MTRIRLESYPGQAHELTFSCAGRRPYLGDPELARTFLHLLDQARSEAQFALHAYVVMPEHCHLTDPTVYVPDSTVRTIALVP